MAKKKKQPVARAREPEPEPRRAPERLRSRIDLDAVVFDGDRDLRGDLMRDEAFRARFERAGASELVGDARRDLLLRSLKLNARIAPNLFAALDQSRRVLGLEAPVEAYCMPSSDMNAFVTPPQDGRVLLGVSSEILERMDEPELTFVVGHELGHVLFDHFSLSPELLLEGEERPSPIAVARLFAWMRYAELSADRVGLVCCQDVGASIRAFFKLTSGLCDPRFLASAADAAAQIGEVQASALESSPDDWFSTHPYGPLRLRAIQLFGRSQPYHSVLGRVGGNLSEPQLEAEVSALMELMDPSFLAKQSPHRAETHEFLAVGGIMVALADGRLERSEEELLGRLLDDGELRLDRDDLPNPSSAAFRERISELGRFLAMRLTVVRRQKILEDLAAIALADRQLASREMTALRRLARLLELEPRSVDEALARVKRALD